MKSHPEITILDVRTSAEFSKGHIENALNIDWNSANFEKGVAVFDKNKPFLVYCLSGNRSGAATSFLRKNGFKEVYELEGGLMKWRSAGLPEVTHQKSLSKTLTMDQYLNLVKSEKYVLVDFYADWCGPCRQMKPHLDAFASENSDKVEVIRIHADDNKSLLQALLVDELPTLYLYKNEQITWRHIGFIDKVGLLSQIK
jgi:thioredoxin